VVGRVDADSPSRADGCKGKRAAGRQRQPRL